MTGPSAEARCLLALARGARPSVSGPLRADELIRLGALHQVDAVAYHAVRRLEGVDLPPAAVRGFQQAIARNMLAHGRLRRALAHLCEGLDARGVPFLVTKGPWLAFAAWPESSARPIGDIDLVIRERDWRGAVEVLTAADYRPVDPLPATGDEALRRAHFGRQVRFAAEGRHPVETHFRLFNIGPPRPEEAWVWASARPLEVGPVTLRVPGPTAMALHLVLHVAQHGFAILRLLLDVRWALSADVDAIDWARFETEVTRLRARSLAWHVLEMAREVVGAPVPAGVSDRLRPRTARRAVFERLWRLDDARALALDRSRAELEAPVAYLLAMGSPRDKLVYTRGLVAEAGGVVPFVRRLRAAIAGARM